MRKCLLLLMLVALPSVQAFQVEFHPVEPPGLDAAGTIRYGPGGIEMDRLRKPGEPDLPLYREIHRFPAGSVVGEPRILERTTEMMSIPAPLARVPAQLPPGFKAGSAAADAIGTGLYPDCWFRVEQRMGLDPETLQPTLHVVVRVHPVRVEGTRIEYLSSLRLELPVTVPGTIESRDDAGLLILGPQEFLDELGGFIAHKEARGFQVATRSTEDIQAVEAGRDLQEKVKRAIERAYDESGILFVLLVGDTAQIPVRYTFHDIYVGLDAWLNTPSDLYYADLFDAAGEFCDWDANGNDIFAEWVQGNVDGCDMLADVLIGRLPVNSTVELAGVVDKILFYEGSLTGTEDWLDRITLAGADTYTYEEFGDTTGIPETEALSERITADFLGSYRAHRMYETEYYPRDEELTVPGISAALEEGSLILNLANHGNVDNWGWHHGSYTTAEVRALQNADRPAFVVVHACITASFDTERPENPFPGYDECLGEAFLLNPDGGAIGYVGNTRLGLGGGQGVGNHRGGFGIVDYSLFQALARGHSNVGRLLLHATNRLVLDKSLSRAGEFITALETVYLGDPTVSLAGAPQEPDLDLAFRGVDDGTGGDGDGCLEPGETVELVLELANAGAAASGITAMLQIDDPDVTVVGGGALPDLAPGQRREILPRFQVTLAGGSPSDRAVELVIQVDHQDGTVEFRPLLPIGEGPWITGRGLWLTLDENEDNLANPGERIRFSIACHNLGCEPAVDLTWDLTLDETWLVYQAALDTSIPPIEPGQTWTPEDMFTLQIDPEAPDGTVIQGHATIGLEGRDRTWELDLELPVVDTCMPRIDRIRVDPLEPAPGELATVTVRALDGAGVDFVGGRLYGHDLEEEILFELLDDGQHGDGAAGDGVFGCLIQMPDRQTFCFLDVTARDGQGFEGTAIRVGSVSTVPFSRDHSILVVSGSEEDLYLGMIGQALQDGGYGYDLWSRFRGPPPESILGEYRDGAVIWFIGGTEPMLGPDERQAIEAYLAQGGDLLISDQSLGWALTVEGTEESRQWYRDVLLAELVDPDVSMPTVTGIAGDPLSDGLEFAIQGGSGALNQEAPNGIRALPPAEPCFQYQLYPDPEEAVAGIRAERSGSRLVHLAFGLEGIATQADRAEVMTAVMEWFEAPRETPGCPWNQSPGWWTGPETPSRSVDPVAAYHPPDSRIYLAGGEPIGGLPDPSIYFIDTNAGSGGDTGVDLGWVRWRGAAASLQGPDGPRLYFASGLDAADPARALIRSVEVFDPAAGTVEVLASDPLPDELIGPPACWTTSGGRLYLIGEDFQSLAPTTGATWVFDPLAAPGQRWRNLEAELQYPRVEPAVAVLDRKIHVLGGMVMGIPYPVVEVLDLDEPQPAWSMEGIALLPRMLSYAGAVGIPEGSNSHLAGKILLAGGFGLATYIQSYLYDPATDHWQEYWPLGQDRCLQHALHYVHSPRGPELWAVGGYLYELYPNTEIFRLGSDPRGAHIGIRTDQDVHPAGSTLRVGLDLAGDRPASAVDCYAVMDLSGLLYFLTVEPDFPSFTADPVPLFSNTPLPWDTTYSGPLLEVPLPSGMEPVSGTFYAGTFLTGTDEPAGGIAWTEFEVQESP